MNCGDVTRLLGRVRNGDRSARDALFRIVYDEIRKLASAKMHSFQSGHTLQPTAVANEAVIRILQRESIDLGENRKQFFSLAAHAIRSVLVDHARRRQAAKRSREGHHCRIALTAIAEFERMEQLELLELNESLEQLKTISWRQHEVVMLRYFGGLRFQEIAEYLGVSKSTAEKDWHFARAWLRKQLAEGTRIAT